MIAVIFGLGILLAFITRRSSKKNNVLILGSALWFIAYLIGNFTKGYVLEYYTYFIFMSGMALTYMAHVESNKKGISPNNSFLSHLYTSFIVDRSNTEIDVVGEIEKKINDMKVSYSYSLGAFPDSASDDLKLLNINFYPEDVEQEENAKDFFSKLGIPYATINFEEEEEGEE